MNAIQFSDALGKVNDKYIMEAITYECKKKSSWLKWGTMAACFGLILTTTMMALSGILKGSGSVMPPPGPGPVVNNGDELNSTDPIEPSVEQNVTINWNNVVVNESDGMALDSAPLYRDPALYIEKTWGEDEIVAYYGWNLAPNYIPEGLSDGGRNASAGIWEERATGEIVQEQAGRGFWSDFWEDGSPKSDDDIVIPTGFTVIASKLSILHCALMPVDDSKATDFDGVPVTLSHCSLPHGPFDPAQKDPSGLYNMPAGYYDFYVASFVMDGVNYEINAQRLALEEVIKIVASVIHVSSGENCIVGNDPPSFPDIPERGEESVEYLDTVINPGFDPDEPSEFATP